MAGSCVTDSELASDEGARPESRRSATRCYRLPAGEGAPKGRMRETPRTITHAEVLQRLPLIRLPAPSPAGRKVPHHVASLAAEQRRGSACCFLLPAGEGAPKGRMREKPRTITHAEVLQRPPLIRLPAPSPGGRRASDIAASLAAELRHYGRRVAPTCSLRRASAPSCAQRDPRVLQNLKTARHRWRRI